MNSTTEDYIKHIYNLQTSGAKGSTRKLAERMNISMPSVSEMVKKLTDAGYLTSKPYQGFKLTSKGEYHAVKLVRKHRLLEFFLINTLGYEWEEIHYEAEELEHAVTVNFINRLDKFLGFPKYDPHGHPIPDIKGKVRYLKSLLPLSEVEAGKNYIVAQVNDISKEILKQVKVIGIKLNSKIKIVDVLSSDGSVKISLRGKQHLLSRKISESIFVIPNTSIK